MMDHPEEEHSYILPLSLSSFTGETLQRFKRPLFISVIFLKRMSFFDDLGPIYSVSERPRKYRHNHGEQLYPVMDCGEIPNK